MLSSMNNKWDLIEVRDLSTYNNNNKSSLANLASSATSSITLTAQRAGWISGPFKSSINYFGTLIRPAWQLKRHHSYLQAWITTDADKLGRHNNNNTWLEMALLKHLLFFLELGRGLNPVFSFSSYWSFCNNKIGCNLNRYLPGSLGLKTTSWTHKKGYFREAAAALPPSRSHGIYLEST